MTSYLYRACCRAVIGGAGGCFAFGALLTKNVGWLVTGRPWKPCTQSANLLANTQQIKAPNERFQKILDDDARDGKGHGFLGVRAGSGGTARYTSSGGRAGGYGSHIGSGGGGVPNAVRSLMGRARS